MQHETRLKLQILLTDFFLKTIEFAWLHCKQVHQPFYCCISDKGAAQGVFAVLNQSCCYHGNYAKSTRN